MEFIMCIGYLNNIYFFIIFLGILFIIFGSTLSKTILNNSTTSIYVFLYEIKLFLDLVCMCIKEILYLYNNVFFLVLKLITYINNILFTVFSDEYKRVLYIYL